MAPPKPKKKAAAASGDGGPFASVTQDGRAWHRLVWLSKMVSLTVEDVSMEMTTLFAPAGAAAPGSTYACVSGGFASFTVGATHVVHPKQVLSLDVNLKGLWARGVTKRQSTGACFIHIVPCFCRPMLLSQLTFDPSPPSPTHTNDRRRGRRHLRAAGGGGHGHGHRP